MDCTSQQSVQRPRGRAVSEDGGVSKVAGRGCSSGGRRPSGVGSRHDRTRSTSTGAAIALRPAVSLRSSARARTQSASDCVDELGRPDQSAPAFAAPTVGGMLHPRLGMPNDGTARHRRRALPISTDRHSGGCKAGPCRRYVIQLTLEACRGGDPAADVRTGTRSESPRSLGGRRTLPNWMIYLAESIRDRQLPLEPQCRPHLIAVRPA
jgi:hypothetical protein